MRDSTPHRRTRRARLRTLAVMVVSLAGLLTGAAVVASPAAAQNPVASACGNPVRFGAMCYFFRSGYRGAQAGFTTQNPDLSNPVWVFGAGEGQGQRVYNNAGSGHNRDTACDVTIYTGTFYSGNSITLTRGTSHPTLGIVNNRNLSHFFHSCI